MISILSREKKYLKNFYFPPFLDDYQIVVEVATKITNITWNNDLGNPNSQPFMDLKTDLETEFDKTFCNISIASSGNFESCYTEVKAFAPGSVYVLFEVNQMVEMYGMSEMLSEAQILTNLQHSIMHVGTGNYEINENLVMISKWFYYQFL